MTKKLLTVFSALLLMLGLTGCGASVSLYTGSTQTYAVQTLEVRLPGRLHNDMEKTAAVIPDTYKRWTVSNWLTQLCRLVVFSDNTQFEFERSYLDGEDFVARMTRRIPFTDDQEPDPEIEQTVKDYFFVYTVEVTQPNPFNGLRAAYDEAAPGQNGNLMQMIKNGIGYFEGETYVEVLPSLVKAFPLVKGYEPDELKLNLYMGGSSRMASTGTKTVINGQTYYLWERTFDFSEETVTMKYYRPNSLGWNVTALIAASAVIGVILMVTHKKKSKETLLDRYPYDPSRPEEADRLPSDRGGFRY